jgi:hypothetical protein
VFWQAFQACFTGSVLASFSGLFHRECFGKLFRPVSQGVFWQAFQACFTWSVLGSFSGLFHRECELILYKQKFMYIVFI